LQGHPEQELDTLNILIRYLTSSRSQ